MPLDSGQKPVEIAGADLSFLARSLAETDWVIEPDNKVDKVTMLLTGRVQELAAEAVSSLRQKVLQAGAVLEGSPESDQARNTTTAQLKLSMEEMWALHHIAAEHLGTMEYIDNNTSTSEKFQRIMARWSFMHTATDEARRAFPGMRLISKRIQLERERREASHHLLESIRLDLNRLLDALGTEELVETSEASGLIRSISAYLGHDSNVDPKARALLVSLLCKAREIRRTIDNLVALAESLPPTP